jgi:hypothetical protein
MWAVERARAGSTLEGGSGAIREQKSTAASWLHARMRVSHRALGYLVATGADAALAPSHVIANRKHWRS